MNDFQKMQDMEKDRWGCQQRKKRTNLKYTYLRQMRGGE